MDLRQNQITARQTCAIDSVLLHESTYFRYFLIFALGCWPVHLFVTLCLCAVAVSCLSHRGAVPFAANRRRHFNERVSVGTGPLSG